jgi:hypothetical protein
MKTLVTVVVIAICAALSAEVIPSDAPDRPAGVSAQEWIPVNERMGFIIVPYKEPMLATKQELFLVPPLRGYFVAKRDQTWVRIQVVEPIKGPGAAG